MASELFPVQIESTVASGTAPFILVSPTLIPLLNAQYLNDSPSSAFATSNHSHTFDDLSDVAVAGAASGHVAMYNGTIWTTGLATSAAITSINSDSTPAQTMITGFAGNNFNITTATGITTFNIPTAALTIARGLLSSGDWSTFNNKISNSLLDSQIIVGNGSNIAANRTMGGDATINNVGTVTLATVTVAKGGTSATIRGDAINNLMPTQSAGGGVNTSGTYATSNGTGIVFTRLLGSGNTLAFRTASQFILPSSGYAQFDVITGGSTPNEYVPCIAFDPSIQEYADVLIHLDEDYRGGDIAVTLGYTYTSLPSTGSVLLGVAFQTLTSTTNLNNAKTYDYNQLNPTVPATGGIIKEDTVTFTAGADCDNLAANTAALMRITRGATTGVLDNLLADWQLVYVKIRELT